MQREILHKIHIRLSKVVILRDAFSEETVTNAVRISICGRAGKPVAKPGGFWLFLDMGQEPFEIEIQSPVYQTRRIRLTPDFGEEPEEIFLYPSAAYPAGPGQTMIRGNAGPGTAVWFHLQEGAPEGRLIRDCRKGDREITVFTREAAGAWRKWYIWDKEKGTGEYLQMREIPGESQRCTLMRPLQYDYRKKDTALRRAYRCAADEEGQFFLLLEHLKEQRYTLYYAYIEKGREVRKETVFEPGDPKQINIGMEES